VIGVHGEGHELLQRHAILGIDLKQGRGDGGKFQALLHDLRRHEEGGSNLCVALALVAEGHKRAELVERVQGDALHVLGQGIVLGQDVGRSIADDAGNGRGICQTLLLHQQGQGLEPTATGRDLEPVGLGAIISQHGPHAQALQETAAGDVFGQFLDGHASLDAPYVGLAQHQLVKRDIPRRGQGDSLDSFGHQIFSTTGAGSHSPDLTSRHPSNQPSFPSR